MHLADISMDLHQEHMLEAHLRDPEWQAGQAKGRIQHLRQKQNRVTRVHGWWIIVINCARVHRQQKHERLRPTPTRSQRPGRKKLMDQDENQPPSG